MRVLFVCDDNRRSSPMAAAFLYHQQRLRKIDNLVVASAGFVEGGRRLDPSVVTLLEDRGVDLSRKRSRRLSQEIVARADLIVTMTAGQAVRVMREYPVVAERVFTLRHLCAVITSRPDALNAMVWIRQLQRSVPRDYESGSPLLDIANPVGSGFGPTLGLADQLLVAIDHVTRCLWPHAHVAPATT